MYYLIESRTTENLSNSDNVFEMSIFSNFPRWHENKRQKMRKNAKLENEKRGWGDIQNRGRRAGLRIGLGK